MTRPPLAISPSGTQPAFQTVKDGGDATLEPTGTFTEHPPTFHTVQWDLDLG